MSGFLRVAGGFTAFAGGLLGFILSLRVVYSDFGGLAGVFLGLILYPLTFILIPFYTLLVEGSWILLLIIYGSIIAALSLAWIANELEPQPEPPGIEPESNPVKGAAKAKSSVTLMLLFVSGLILVVVSSTLANPGSAPTPTSSLAPAKPPLPRPIPTQSPVSMHACTTDSTVHIRRRPGTQYETVGGIVSGTCMSILGRTTDSSWVYIVTEDDKTGWVAAWLLTINGDVTRVSVRPDSAGMSLAPTAIPGRLIPLCSESTDRLGKYISCKIKHAECVYHSNIDGKPTFCKDGLYPNQDFQLVVFGEDWSNYAGSCIIVSGYLETFKGVLQIQGFSRSQVSYCE